jgi:hypothetical protein
MKLFYIPVRARAEPVRMLLAYGKIPYEDVVFPFAQWPKNKRDTARFPFGQVPSIQLPSGAAIAQTGAVIRFEALLALSRPLSLTALYSITLQVCCQTGQRLSQRSRSRRFERHGAGDGAGNDGY